MKALAQNVGRTLLTGLVAILPIAVTVAVLWWLGATAEQLFGGLLRAVLPDVAYFPGLGVLAGLALLFVLGLLLRAYVVQSLFAFFEGLMQRLPVVKTIYGAVQDVTRMFSGQMGREFGQTVLVRLPGSSMALIGMITRDDLTAFWPQSTAGAAQTTEPTTDRVSAPTESDPVAPRRTTGDDADDPIVAVYLPMSYMIGGYTVLLPRSALTPLDISFEDAMRFAVTAGLSMSVRDVKDSAASRNA